jgi:hypothetical protein
MAMAGWMDDDTTTRHDTSASQTRCGAVERKSKQECEALGAARAARARVV